MRSFSSSFKSLLINSCHKSVDEIRMMRKERAVRCGVCSSVRAYARTKVQVSEQKESRKGGGGVEDSEDSEDSWREFGYGVGASSQVGQGLEEFWGYGLRITERIRERE